MLGKWLVFINCFTVHFVDEQNAPESLFDFLTKYNIIISGMNDCTDVDDELAREVAPMVDGNGWPCKQNISTTAEPITLADTNYLH